MKKNITYILLPFLITTYCEAYTEKKIKMYTFYTPSHEFLKDEWFLTSLKDDFEIIAKRCEQISPSASYMQEGWNQTMLFKIDLIIEAIAENFGNVFIYSDVDIQFFRPIQELILNAIENNDMVIQKDRPDGSVCVGFFALRANERTLKLWVNIRKMLIEEEFKIDDQTAFRRLIDYSDVKWDRLPDIFFSAGTLTAERWVPGKELPVPAGIVLHHANWTVGIENKIAQLEYVRNLVDEKGL